MAGWRRWMKSGIVAKQWRSTNCHGRWRWRRGGAPWLHNGIKIYCAVRRYFTVAIQVASHLRVARRWYHRGVPPGEEVLRYKK